MKKIDLKGVKRNVSLAEYTTFRIGGKAKYFFEAATKEELVEAVKAAKRCKLPFFVLGGGSNILVNDKGFQGLVIKNETKEFKIKGRKIIAGSGAILARVIESSIKAGLTGLENGTGIPGTLGGAVFGNTGFIKGMWEIGNFVKEVEILMPTGKIKRVGNSWLSFSYRNSRIKKEKLLILEVVLELKKSNFENLKKKRQEILKSRSKKIPSGFSAGSVFINPSGLYAAKLIEDCGLKGKKIGRAQISEKHANFIINLGGAKAKDVKGLIKLAKNRVKGKFKVNFEEEIRCL